LGKIATAKPTAIYPSPKLPQGEAVH